MLAEYKKVAPDVTIRFQPTNSGTGPDPTLLTLAAIPVLGLYLGMSSQFIKGVTAGSVKG